MDDKMKSVFCILLLFSAALGVIVLESQSSLKFEHQNEKDAHLHSFKDFPFRNTSLPWDVRVNDLVSRLETHELVLQMARGGSEPWSGPSPAIPRLGIGEYVWNTECLNGVVRAENATAFPQAIGIAATFSPALVKQVAQAIGEEVRGKHNYYSSIGIFASYTGASCFSPVINIARDPRWGRIQETYGEDPFLTGQITEAFITGLQGNDSRFIRASGGCKHFDAYAGPEKGRGHFDAKVSEYDLRNTFLPAFKKCVDSGTYSIMCSYNSINGVPACANKKFLTDILRKEWGFKGYVVSDDTAIEQVMTGFHYVETRVDAAAVCANAGVNLELTAALRHQIYVNLDEALRQGKITKDLLRERVKPLFYTRMRLGHFDPPEKNPYTLMTLNASVVETMEHQNLAIKAAMKSFVLLKNVDEVLPVKPENYKRVSVVGPMANNATELQGYYTPITEKVYLTTPLEGIRKIFPVKFKKVCFPGPECKEYKSELVKPLVGNADLVFVALGTGQILERETKDRESCDLQENQKQLLLDVIKYSPTSAKIVLLLFNAGPLNVTFADDSDRVHAIVEGFLPAQGVGPAIYNVLTNHGGNSSPAGRLPQTWPKLASSIPPITDYTMKGRTYRYIESPPLYPFGYGLSYTTFKYSDLVAPKTVGAKTYLKVKVNVANTGKVTADEVIQCYLSWTNKTLPTPKLQLAYINRVDVKVGQTITQDITISPESWTIWYNGSYKVFKGDMNVYCGGQQPGQEKKGPSNVVNATFRIV